MTGGCGKRRHTTQLAAIASALRCSARRGTPLRVYRCPNCGGWHLTSKTRPARSAP